MRGLNVKSTMLDSALEIIAPHHCCGCGKVGSLLCLDCKYNITSESFEICVGCLTPTGVRGVCANCRLPYQNAWCVDMRDDAVKVLINRYKFARAKAAHSVFIDLLDETVPMLPASTIIVPIPTVATHIRQRGYDHMALIAKGFAARRGVPFTPLLRRKTQSVQLGASKVQRDRQAREAFYCSDELDADIHYVIIDDVFTTGATMKYAAMVLRVCGAENVSIAVVSRQPVDELST